MFNVFMSSLCRGSSDGQKSQGQQKHQLCLSAAVTVPPKTMTSNITSLVQVILTGLPHFSGIVLLTSRKNIIRSLSIWKAPFYSQHHFHGTFHSRAHKTFECYIAFLGNVTNS